ncbi:zinc finger protein ZAT3-like [Benincasa hispida]|uniref:zinc finger protein ZAT3-like n=1 Tax=Benincasa hispida TaxID=102211 RepID=UPI0019018C7C|nr:zinc finger protein ZAT3-like [Benincasa hispida]
MMDSFSVFPPTCTSDSSSNPRRKRTKFMKTTTSGKPTKQPKKPDSTAANNITPPCSECGKKFWSWKALFGHMRCHPERQWRGIKPPPNLLRPSTAAELRQDHEIAACLIMLANAPSDGSGRGTAEDYKRRSPFSGILDLNLPPPPPRPPMEVIEEESSSSYSSGIVLDLRLGLN